MECLDRYFCRQYHNPLPTGFPQFEHGLPNLRFATAYCLHCLQCRGLLDDPVAWLVHGQPRPWHKRVLTAFDHSCPVAFCAELSLGMQYGLQTPVCGSRSSRELTHYHLILRIPPLIPSGIGLHEEALVFESFETHETRVDSCFPNVSHLFRQIVCDYD